MALHTISLLGVQTVPDNSGNCWQEPYSILATNDVWPFLIFRFGLSNAAAPTTRIGLYGSTPIPDNYTAASATAPIITPVWTATLTSGDVVWDFDYRAVGGNDTESLDQAGTQEAVTLTDTAPGAANRRLTPTVALTTANLLAGDTLEWGLFRDGADAADTMAGSAILVDLLLTYSDT